MLNYKRFTFNSHHSVFYCISKYYLHGPTHFCPTITLSHGIPIETVSKMLGHTSIKTTQIYAKILDTKVMDDMAALKELYTRKESQKSPDNKAVNG